ncbi:hypothetical protein [Micrococcus luteus]|uniref:hypothetical protein n=1 Tax=Micrococcus luteus TaxID=1270 RepID=UPI0036A0C62B
MLFVYPALFVVSFKVTTVVAGAGRGAPQWWYFSMAVLVIGLIYVGIVHVSTSGKFRVVYSTARGAAIMIANAKADGWHMEQFYKSYPWIKSEKRKTSTRDLWTITARAIEHAADHHGVTVRAIAMNERVSLLYIDKFPRLTVASPSTWGERMAVRFGRVLLMSEPQTCEHPRCEWPRTAVLPIESEEA